MLFFDLFALLLLDQLHVLSQMVANAHTASELVYQAFYSQNKCIESNSNRLCPGIIFFPLFFICQLGAEL